jgi:membrane fusion protein, multidrug efflux system
LNRSYVIAAILTLGIGGWVIGGYALKSKETGTAGPEAEKVTAQQPMTVAVRKQSAESVQQYIVAQGQAEPNRKVSVRAETAGQIGEILVEEGAKVSAGDVIAKLKINDRQARLDRAEARLTQEQGAWDAAQSLGKKGYQTQRQSDEAYAALQTAKAELEEARIELEHTQVRAPFGGTLLTRDVELGTYVAVNGEIGMIVDNDPLVIRVDVAQQNVRNVKKGLSATVSFATGEKRDGKVRYVAAQADENTRTFRVEIEVANPDGAIPSGISVEARIPTTSVMAHFVSPAALSLNDEGILGVKAVNGDRKVVFHKADIVRSDGNGVWIAGLPEQATIITNGQGFVRVGEEVRVAEEGSGEAPGAGDGAGLLSLSRADNRNAAQ